MAGNLDSLMGALAEEAARPVHPAVMAAADAIRARHAGAAVATLFYGSCLRRGGGMAPDPDGVLDFYLLVDGYGGAYPGRPLLAAANAVLAPNVFYVETPWRGGVLRAKYAVMTLARFARGASRRSLQPMVWARFAQPARLLWARNDGARRAVVAALAEAVVSMVGAALPRAGVGAALPPINHGAGVGTAAAEIWPRAFAESYRAELRPEPAGQARALFEADRERYERLTPWALALAGGGGGAPWVLRRIWGKLLNLLRLIKAAFTYDGALDYLLWKIERHSGVAAGATPWQRRHPLLAAPALAWRLYRLGAFR